MDGSLTDAQLELAKVLKDIRKKHSLTQIDLARRLGVSQATISLAESGERELPVQNLRILAETFGVNLTGIVGAARPSEILDALQAAWKAYEQARAEYLALAERAQMISEALEKKGSTTPQQQSALKDWSSSRFRESLKARAPQPRADRSDFRTFAPLFVPSSSRTSRVANLLTVADSLSEADLNLLLGLACRFNTSEGIEKSRTLHE